MAIPATMTLLELQKLVAESKGECAVCLAPRWSMAGRLHEVRLATAAMRCGSFNESG